LLTLAYFKPPSSSFSPHYYYYYYQMVQRHAHKTMHEVFFVEQGTAVFLVDEEHHVIEKGGFIHIPKGEPHSLLNLASGSEDNPEGNDLILLYFGVVDES